MHSPTLPRLSAAAQWLRTATLALAAAAISHTATAGGLDSLAQFLKDVRSGQARFTQEVQSPAREGQPARSKTQSGQFAFKRPGQFRFDYGKPFAQTIVADGQTLWLYDPDLQQATARRQADALGNTPAAIVAAATTLKALEQDFKLSEEPIQDGLQWVKAVPKTGDGQLQNIRVGLAAEPGQPPRLAVLDILDHFGQRSVLRFEQFETNPQLPPAHFQFTPPAGVDVLRQ